MYQHEKNDMHHYCNLAIAEDMEGHYKKALKYYKKAYKIASSTGVSDIQLLNSNIEDLKRKIRRDKLSRKNSKTYFKDWFSRLSDKVSRTKLTLTLKDLEGLPSESNSLKKNKLLRYNFGDLEPKVFFLSKHIYYQDILSKKAIKILKMETSNLTTQTVEKLNYHIELLAAEKLRFNIEVRDQKRISDLIEGKVRHLEDILRLVKDNNFKQFLNEIIINPINRGHHDNLLRDFSSTEEAFERTIDAMLINVDRRILKLLDIPEEYLYRKIGKLITRALEKRDPS